MLRYWIEAFRLRTLALSFSITIMGSAMAYCDDCFDFKIFGAAMLTTLFLQILSNLSNDYGDNVSGVDNADRLGPQRGVQSGAISRPAMKRAIRLFIGLSLVSGICLLVLAFERLKLWGFILMLLVGICAICAAILYTIGRRPYGYRGFGDLSVFVFFGIVGVCGTYTVYAGQPSPGSLLPAAAIGLLSVGVLNLNNMRDYDNDAHFGKRTLPVRMGLAWAKAYHTAILLLSIIAMVTYVMLFGKSEQLIVLFVAPVLLTDIKTVWRETEVQYLDGELKKVSLAAFFQSILFSLGSVIG